MRFGRIEEFVDRSTVRINTVDGGFGSGFFVAPGLIVTCAHVVQANLRGGMRKPVTVSWAGGEVTGTVISVVPSGAPDATTDSPLWPEPDLAVIKVSGHTAGSHPWITLADSLYSTPGSDLYVFGYSGVYKRAGQWRGSRPAGFAGFEGRLFRIAESELPPGNSGGPVLDRAEGSVCAIVKTARLKNSGLGGLAIPVDEVRQALPEVWAASRDAPNPLWDAATTSMRALREPSSDDTRMTLRREACRGMGTRDLTELYWDLAGPLAPRPGRVLVDGTDLVRALYEVMGEPGDQNGALGRLDARFGLPAAGRTESGKRRRGTGAHGPYGAIARLLGQGKVALRTQPGKNPAPSGKAQVCGPVLVVRISETRIGKTRKYLVTVWSYGPGQGPARNEYSCDSLLSLHECRRAVGEAVSSALNRSPAGDLRIEFAVPRRLLHEPVESWHLGHSARPLGVDFAVVVRLSDRDGQADFAWRRRAEHLARTQSYARVSGAHWFCCGELRPLGQLYGELQGLPQVTAVALEEGAVASTRLPPAMTASLDAGVPIIMWHRAPCAVHLVGNSPAAERACTGERFRVLVDEEFGEHDFGKLPELLRLHRAKAATMAGTNLNAAQDVVLFWDDPARTPWRDLASLVEPR